MSNDELRERITKIIKQVIMLDFGNTDEVDELIEKEIEAIGGWGYLNELVKSTKCLSEEDQLSLLSGAIRPMFIE